MRKRWCSVCAGTIRAEVDNALLDPRTSLTTLAKKVGVTRDTIRRHRDRCFADKAAKALQIQQAVTVTLEAVSTGSAIEALVAEAQRDRSAALERGDHKLALRAIDTLLRAHELHARLVIEASTARARDVANHPVFQSFAARQARVLCTACRRATARLAADDLGYEPTTRTVENH